jgi:tryptophanyl-tRNA synthetase
MGMLTDVNRARRSDPGNPDICNLFPYHKLMSEAGQCAEIEAGCRGASWGCVDCKKALLTSMERFLAPIHARRAELDQNPDQVRALLDDGNRRAQQEAEKTLSGLRALLNFDF